MTRAASPALPEDFLDRIDQQLGDTDTFLARCYPGEDARRQPVHTVYVPADRYSADLPWQWGNAAMALVDQHGGIEALCTDLGLTAELVTEVAPRVVAKLQNEPIEDLRLDFEDGYGNRGETSRMPKRCVQRRRSQRRSSPARHPPLSSSTPPSGRTGSSRPPSAGRAPRRPTRPGWELLVSAEAEV